MESYLLIVLLNVAFYWRTLNYGLVMDDIDWYRQREKDYVGSKIGFHTFFNLGTYITRAYGPGTIRLNPRIDHITTLLLHIATALLINKLFNLPTALLWSFHPVNHQVSIWLTGRRYAILNIMVLIILITQIYYFAIPILLILFKHFTQRHKERNKLPHSQPTILNVLKAFGFNTLKILLPRRILGIYPFLELGSSPPQMRYAIVGIISILLISYAHPVIAILILLNSGIVPHQQPCADRYLSLPLIFLCALVPVAISIPLIIYYCYKTWELMPLYQNITNFYNYHTTHAPTMKKLPLLKRLYNL